MDPISLVMELVAAAAKIAYQAFRDAGRTHEEALAALDMTTRNAVARQREAVGDVEKALDDFEKDDTKAL